MKRILGISVVGVLSLSVGACALVNWVSASERKSLTVEDSVRTRRIIGEELAISPDGNRVAYVLKAPDPATNKNNYELLVRDLGQTSSRDNGLLLLNSDELSDVRWLADSQTVAVLSRVGEETSVNFISVTSGKREIAAGPARGIRSFGVDDRGDVVVYSAGVPSKENGISWETRDSRGFSVIPGKPVADSKYLRDQLPDSELVLVRRFENGERETTRLRATGLAAQPLEHIAGNVDHVEVSPDGTYVAFEYVPDILPESWNASVYVRGVKASGLKSPVWEFMEIGTGYSRIAINAPSAGYMPLTWAKDSKSFVVNTLAPFGSVWEKQDIAAGFQSLEVWDSYLHLFAVSAKTGAVSEILQKYLGFSKGRILWKRSDRELLVPADNGTVLTMKQVGHRWMEVDRSFPPSLKNVEVHDVTMTANRLVGIREDIQTPPDLFVYGGEANRMVILTDLNPEYRGIELGKITALHWTNAYGVPCEGQLIWPVGYREGQKYPLVLMNAPTPGVFVSDGTYTTAFPPQSLANAGFFVLMAEYVLRDDLVPKVFPVQLGEAYNYMMMIESAVATLSERQLVEPTKIGIIGFSSTSAKVDFMLTHSKLKFAAASSADGGLYNYGSYWLYNQEGVASNSEATMGGAPYGSGFQNWLKYAPAFNAQNVQTPLLMEYVGYGLLPTGPIVAYEFFSALYRQGKPVELYFYPRGNHPLDTPFERVASLQRNVDWFRFWMQGWEGAPPSYDTEQYVRWRALREAFERSN